MTIIAEASNDWPPLDALGGLGRPADTAHHRRGEVGRLHAGLWVVAWVRLVNGTVADASFEVYGPLSALVIADWLVTRINGCSWAQACDTSGREALDALGLPADAGGEALRIEEALQSALACNDDGGSNEY